jgi:hypothetical protein
LTIDELPGPEFVFDAGSVPMDRPSVWTFTLRNAGGGTLTLDKITSSCGCIALTVSARSLAPGQTASLAVHYPQEVDEGSLAISHFVRITSNDPLSPLTEFQVIGMLTRPPG